jgi:uncharacterized protein (TIGR03435 family)
MRNLFGLESIAVVLISAGTALGQAAPAAQASPAVQAPAGNLTFDVASVRQAAPINQAAMMESLRAGKRPESMRVEGSRATYTYMSLKELIAAGYKVRTYQIDGPDWMASDRFDISAKLPDGASKDDAPGMLQALLVERFKLTAHLETKEHPLLGLMVAKGGSKLKQVAAPEAVDENAPLKPGETKVDSVDGPIRLSRNGDGSTTYGMGARGNFTLRVDGQTGTMHMTASGMTLKGLANMLTSLGGGNGRQVVDMTGLKGNYDLAVEFSLSDLVASLRDQGLDIPTGPGGGGGGGGGGASDPGGDTTVSDALQKLGLRLEKSKADLEQLVVDHVEKLPTEN